MLSDFPKRRKKARWYFEHTLKLCGVTNWCVHRSTRIEEKAKTYEMSLWYIHLVKQKDITFVSLTSVRND